MPGCCLCCFKKGVPLSLVVFVVVFMMQLFTMTVIFATTYSYGNEALESMYWRYSWGVYEKISAGADDIVEACILPAREIQFYDWYLQQCDVPTTGTYEPESLVNGFNVHTSGADKMMRRFDLESLGIIKRAAASTNEYTWEIALHSNCSDFAYVYVDDTTEGRMIGWCGFRNGSLPGPQVLDTDAPRLSPVEEELFEGALATYDGAFLPIEFSWVEQDKLTIIYELPYRCNGTGAVYATTYAEKSLAQIDRILEDAAAEDEPGTVYFIVEAQTTYLASASVKNQTVSVGAKGQRSRVMFFDARDPVIREAAYYLKATAGSHGLKYFEQPNSYRSVTQRNDLIIHVLPYRPRQTSASGIEWIIVRVIPSRNVWGKVASIARPAFIVFGVITLVQLVVTFFMVRVFVRALQQAAATDEEVDIGDSCIAEIRGIRDNIKNGNYRHGNILLQEYTDRTMEGGSGGGGEKKD